MPEVVPEADSPLANRPAFGGPKKPWQSGPLQGQDYHGGYKDYHMLLRTVAPTF